MKYVLLDDDAIEIGGTNLTILSMFEDRIDQTVKISTKDISKLDIIKHADKVWIIGNIMNLFQKQDDTREVLFDTIKKFVKIEFDYNFCPYRGEIPHEKLGNVRCSCPYGTTGISQIANTYNKIIENSSHIFFMSERQRSIYANHMPLLDFSKTTVLSSCFSKHSLNMFESLRTTPKNNRYAVLQGFGGWHSEAKGADIAKNFCITNNLEYDILPIQKYENHIKTLSQYKGLVFLPIIDDTCPRAIIEARLLGLHVITNINCQHVTEWWWKDESKTLDYISSRPQIFWSILDKI